MRWCENGEERKEDNKESFFLQDEKRQLNRERERERETGPIQFLAPAVAPGYRWSGSKKWELQLPGFHSNVDAGREEREKDILLTGERNGTRD